ncbi:hypothetical protein PG994_004211 [Apiospora phragmitis]|uniref:Uncharacterized protein n=1 Tax=Apiospora phragmitis TaxID=2905665 RepID=A0ABR1VR42_9PEZI
MSDIGRASFTDADYETGLPVHALFGCEDVQVTEIQTGPVIPSNTNLVLEELVSIRAMLANMEAQLRHLSKAEKPKGTSHSAKRKQSRSPTPPRKRQRKGREVNIRVTRAWLHLDEGPEILEYVWQHDRDGGGYWRQECGPESERVDGEYLLSYGSDLRVQIRPNGDWLPVNVRWNEETDSFGGLDAIDGKVFKVDKVGMMDLMRGVIRSYIGYVF